MHVSFFPSVNIPTSACSTRSPFLQVPHHWSAPLTCSFLVIPLFVAQHIHLSNLISSTSATSSHPPQQPHLIHLSNLISSTSATSSHPPQQPHLIHLSNLISSTSATSSHPPQQPHLIHLSNLISFTSATSSHPPQQPHLIHLSNLISSTSATSPHSPQQPHLIHIQSSFLTRNCMGCIHYSLNSQRWRRPYQPFPAVAYVTPMPGDNYKSL